jgi:argininosuccinate lyase
VHLSRLGEELVLWSTSEFGFITLGEGFCTGSSMLPQKRNPDVAELVRGGSGQLVGDLVSLLTTMKALPLSYNRDMQHDKEPVFRSTDTVLSSLSVMARMLPTLRVNREAMARALDDDSILAVDLVEYLVRKGMPFRHAHERVGGLVAAAEQQHRRLRELRLEALRKHADLFEADVCELFDAPRSLVRKASAGSTSPAMVRAALRRWKRKLGEG